MMLMTRLLAGASFVALSAGMAAAAPAVAQADVNLRAGPGTEYPVITAIPAGAAVNVGSCEASWCQVSFGGTSGFASRGYLGLGGGSVAVSAGPVYGAGPGYGAYEDNAYVGYGPSYGYVGYGPSYGYGYGDGYYGGGGVSVGVTTGDRGFRERGFRDREAFRGDFRGGAETNVNVREREGASVRTRTRGEERVGVRGGERASVRGEASAGARTSEQATTLRGNNPMRNAPNRATNRSANPDQRASTIGGNNPMRNAPGRTANSSAGAGERASTIGGNNPMRNAPARATTGAGSRGGEQRGQR